MLSSPLFRRNFFLFAVIALVFISLSFAINSFYREMQRDRMVRLHPFPAMVTHMLNEVDADPVKAVDRVMSKPEVFKRESIDVIDASGNSVRQNGEGLSSALTPEEVNQLQAGGVVMRPQKHGPPLSIHPTKTASLYFLIGPKHGPPPPPRSAFILPIISVVLSVLLAIGVSLYLMFSTYKKKSVEALSVLGAIRSGDLHARLKTEGMDELKPLVHSFNTMADEVAALVESLQHTDSARRRLLQDLAHDLRTPLTSVKSFLETLKSSSEKIGPEKRAEAINYCISEVNYFSDLVEDLLFLANISEPKYVLANDKIAVNTQIQDVVTLFQAQYRDKMIFCEFDKEDSPILIGSQKLFERLLRNILSNAISFAQSTVRIHVTTEEKMVHISVLDDGPGFTEESLATFGVKKASRQIFKKEEGSRISLGIGSLIIKEITMVHRGTLKHENLVLGGRVQGARIDIFLPIQ